ncbi:MAG TPA: type II toxin-antitoxin system HicB family antitoxin [Candidatus Babeliales bacterium]|jgi:predicted HicB family RNase H-like nuclease|nr:type II toxin-antitoxin system HicB family antitoxin [Candidatus Babeliales bacterium]
MMQYKGYIGNVTYDAEAKIFHGEVIGLKDIITFQGTTVQGLEKAFHDSVDDYLLWCKERGEKPEKTFSGKLNLRIPPELHAHLAVEAAKRNMSLNDFMKEKLSR